MLKVRCGFEFWATSNGFRRFSVWSGVPAYSFTEWAFVVGCLLCTCPLILSILPAICTSVGTAIGIVSTTTASATRAVFVFPFFLKFRLSCIHVSFSFWGFVLLKQTVLDLFSLK